MKTQRKFSFWIVVMALLLLSLACSFGGGEEEEPKGNVLFQDDFSNTGSGWEEGDFDYGSVGYGDGFYKVVSSGQGETMWGAAYKDFTDVVIDVDATVISGPTNYNNDYGVVCRMQENGDGYYLLISSDGLYSILLGAGDSFNPLVDWTESSTIKQGNTSNHIQAICSGSNMTLVVNGKELVKTQDSTHASGDIGLTATTYESTPAEVHFDNLMVTKPAQ